MLLELDLTERVRAVAERGIPILPLWGCFDRVVTNDAADGFARASGSEIQWVPGGHSWMLARPGGVRDILTHIPRGQEFLRTIESRWRELELSAS
jgi:hypothetical protein